jgi:glycerol uptake facilitator-like aquaporin
MGVARTVRTNPAQHAGAVAARLANVAIEGDAGDAGASLPRINGADAAFWSELVLTFFLVFVVFAVATDERAQGGMAAIAIGGYVGFAATGWGPIANASMNPARSFGPAVASGAWEAHWVYWAAPIAGALLAAIVYEVLRAPRPESLIDPRAPAEDPDVPTASHRSAAGD